MNNLSIKQLNNTLADEAKIDVVTYNKFKIIDHSKGTKFDRIIAASDYARKLPDGYELVLFFNGGKKSIRVNYNGEISVNGSEYKFRQDKHSNGHSRINHLNDSLLAERLIMVCKNIIDDEMPVSYRGIVCNVMDGTGAKNTADELGLPVNMKEENLEMTLKKRNLRHGSIIKKLVKITGKVYKFSANDKTLYDLIDVGTDEQIKEYMETHYEMTDYCAG